MSPVAAPFRTLPRGERPRALHLAELRRLRIGPAFPEAAEAGQRESRKVGRGGKDTKPPFRRQRLRKGPENVVAVCLSCPWRATGSAWRPIRRRLAEHTAKKHVRLATGAA